LLLARRLGSMNLERYATGAVRHGQGIPRGQSHVGSVFRDEPVSDPASDVGEADE